MAHDWMLLVYTVPSQPTRKRAYVWRELKRLGALYLRDGVALLPHRPDLEDRLQAVADRIREYDGTVDLLLSPRFVPNRDDELVRRFQDERLAEYRELHHGCVRFLRDVLEEVGADVFSFPDVDKLESELKRLRGWYEQIMERDYFQAPGSDRVRDILAKCEEAFERFASTASSRVEGKEPTDDVFERLGGSASSDVKVPDEYPL